MSAVCEVTLNDQECEHPPGYQVGGMGGPIGSSDSVGLDLPGIRTRCWQCGKRACKTCSTLVRSGRQRHRICNDCLEEGNIRWRSVNV